MTPLSVFLYILAVGGALVLIDILAIAGTFLVMSWIDKSMTPGEREAFDRWQEQDRMYEGIYRQAHERRAAAIEEKRRKERS